MLFVQLSELAMAELAKVWKINESLLFHLIVHVDDLLLGRGQAKGLHGSEQVLQVK